MKTLALLVATASIAVFATAAVTGTAGTERASSWQASTASLQAQINELRSELICLDTIAGDGIAADGYWAASASGTPKAETGVNDRGVCKKLGVITQGTTPVPNEMASPFDKLAHRAFGG